MQFKWEMIFFACAVAVVASRSMAQEFKPPPAQTDGLPEVQVGVVVEHDSNVAESDAAVASERKITPADWIYSPTINLDIVRPIGPETIFLRGDAGYKFYQTNTVLNRESLDLQGGVNGHLGLCHATVSGSLGRHQSDLRDVTLAVGPDVKNVEELNSVELDGDCVRQIGFGPSFSISQAWDSNSGAQFHSFDYRLTTITAGLVYQRPIFGQLSIFGQYDEADYPNQLVTTVGPPIQNKYSLYAGGVRFERGLGARIDATLSLAYTALNPVASVRFSGLTYRADVSYRASSRVKAHVQAERSVKPADLIQASFLRDDKYLAEGSFAVGARLVLTAGVSDERRQYGGASLIPASENNNEQLQDAYSSVRYDFARRFFVSFDGRYEKRRGNVLELNYNEARLGFSLGAKF